MEYPTVGKPQSSILVVDDDRVMRLQMRRAMEQEGYQVLEASNGEQALEIYANSSPDIVLLDAVMMPVDGFTCCSQLRALSGRDQPPILMITALNDQASVDRAFDAGATDYVTKPIHWAVLRQRVRRLLQASWAMAELRQTNERERLLRSITQQIRRSLDLDSILNTIVEEVRRFLEVERVAIYQINPETRNQFIAESVALGWNSVLGLALDGGYFTQRYPQSYDVLIINDIQQADLPTSDIEKLIDLEIQAALIIPITIDSSLWGMLCAHHCSSLRSWKSFEVELLFQLTDQIAIAIHQAELYQQVQQLATIDALTQLANRRQFDSYLNQEWQHMNRERSPISLILCDVDFFKKYNDTYGHPAGDQCLKQVAQALCTAARRSIDLVARYGGEEFALILPHTSPEGAFQVAEQIRNQVKALEISHTGSPVSPCVTLSLGIASLIPNSQHSPDVLVTAADKALYEAKQAGRDRAVLAQVH